MANLIRVADTDSYITWIRTAGINSHGAPEGALNFTLRDKNGNPIAKAKLTAEQLHKYICMNNTMK